MGKHRIQLLLEQQQYDQLRDIAKAEGTSVSAVVRRFVEQGLERRTDQRRQWLRRAGKLRGQLEDRYGVYAGDPVAEARAERERETDAVLRVDESAETRIRASLLDLEEGRVRIGTASDVLDELAD